MAYRLLHAHGQAGPGGRRSYLQFGKFKTKAAAEKYAAERNFDGKRIVEDSRVKKTSHSKLFYIAKSKTKAKRKPTQSYGFNMGYAGKMMK